MAALGGDSAAGVLAKIAARLNAEVIPEESDALPGSREASIVCEGPAGEELQIWLDTTVIVRLGDEILFEESLRDPETVDVFDPDTSE